MRDTLGRIYQLYDFDVVDLCTVSSSATILAESPSVPHPCPFCASPNEWSTSSAIALNPSQCFRCQLFSCSSCCPALPTPPPLSPHLQRLPPCHFYWLHSLSFSTSFCVIHFLNAPAADSTHSLWSAIASMARCSHCSPNAQISQGSQDTEDSDVVCLVFAPKRRVTEEALEALRAVLPTARVVVVSDETPGEVMKWE